MAVQLSPTPAPVTSPPAQASRPGFGATDLQLLLMALIWGVNFSVVKYGTTALSPLAYNGIRVALAAVALAIVARLARETWPRGRDLRVMFALGVMGNGVYQLFFIEGVSRTRAGTAALVLAASPAFIALLGRLRGTERLRPIATLGIALSIGGVALVLFGNARGTGESASSLLGALLVLCGCLCWAVYTVYLQPYTHRYGGLALSAVTMIAGAIPLVLVGIPAIARTDFAAVPSAAWGAVAYSGLLALVVAYYLWYRGVRILGPTRTAMYGNLQPAIALLVAWVTLGEVPTVWQLVGMGLIGAGVLLVRR
jgi:drug/metabolite transporter (DMT)-like permease